MTLRLFQCSCLEKELQSCQTQSERAAHPSFYSDNLVADIGSSDDDWFEVATRQLANVTIPASQKLDATVIASPQIKRLSQDDHLLCGPQLCRKPLLEQATTGDVQLQAPKDVTFISSQEQGFGTAAEHVRLQDLQNNVMRNTSTPLSQRQPMGSQTDDSDSYRDFFQKVSAPGLHGSSSIDSKDVLHSQSVCLLTPITNTESVELLHLEENTTRDTVGSSVNIGIPVNSSPNGSEYSWSTSMETPPSDKTRTPGDNSQVFPVGDTLQTRQKGLPRALFSPNHDQCDADELVRCLDTTVDEDLHDKVTVIQSTQASSTSETTTSTFASFNDVSVTSNKSSVLHASRDSIIREVLSDFSDTPSQWKKKRKPKPTKGKKRKDVAEIEQISFDIHSPIKNSSFHAENTTLRSILSAGKKTKSATPNTYKRVRFVKNVEFDEDFDKLCCQVDSKTCSKDDSTSISVSNANAIAISQNVNIITENDVKCEELILSNESAIFKIEVVPNNVCKSVSDQIVLQCKMQEEKVTDVYGDMFSQLSPQSLQSMCKVDEVTVQYSETVPTDVCFPETKLLSSEAVAELAASTNSTVISSQFPDLVVGDQLKNSTSDNTDIDVFTQISPSAMDKIFTATDSLNVGHLKDVKCSFVPSVSKQIHEVPTAAKIESCAKIDVTLVKDSVRDISLSTPASEHSANGKKREIIVSTTAKRKLSLGSAGKRFLYPSKKQIGVSCPKTVFNFKSSILPNSVPVPGAKEMLNDKPVAALPMILDEKCDDADWKDRDVTVLKPVFKQKQSNFQKFSTMKLNDDKEPENVIAKKIHNARPYIKRNQVNDVTGNQCMAGNHSLKMTANKLVIDGNNATKGIHNTENLKKTRHAMVIETEKLNNKTYTPGMKSIPSVATEELFSANEKLDSETDNKHSIKSNKINNVTGAELGNSGVSSFGGFSTAKGKTIKMTENAIDKATKLLLDIIEDENKVDAEQTDDKNSETPCRNDGKEMPRKDEDKAVELESNCTGFSTGSGKVIDVSRKAMMNAQALVSSVDEKKMDFSFGGFQTAKGNRVNISENGLLKAKSLMADIGMSDYDTNKSAIAEHELKCNNSKIDENTFLKQSGNILNTNQMSISKENEIKKDYSSFGGFQTATGNEVHISEESLGKAEALMFDVDDNGIACRDITPCKPKNIKIRECLKNTTADINISKSFNSAARKNATERDLSKIPKGFRPFKAPRISTVPKKKVGNSNSTLDIDLQASKDSLMECSDQAFDDSLLMELMADDLTETSGFDHDNNHIITNTKNTFEISETGMISANKLTRHNGRPSGISKLLKSTTAEDLKVSDKNSEEISKFRKATMTRHEMSTDCCDLSVELIAFKSSITKQNDLKRNMISTNNEHGFHDVDAKKAMSVSDDIFSLSDSNFGCAKRIVYERDICNKPDKQNDELLECTRKDCITNKDPNIGICGNDMKNVKTPLFQTASGKTVSVSLDALQQAKNDFHDEAMITFTDNYQENPIPTSNDLDKFESDSLKESETSKMQSNPQKSLFQTASGKNVSVSKKALRKAKQIWIEEKDKINIISEKETSISDETIQPFENIASEQGKNILSHGKTVSGMKNSEGTGNKTKPLSDAQLRSNKKTMKSMDISDKKPSSLFQTASGNNVYVSKGALQKARNSWCAEEDVSHSADLRHGSGNTYFEILDHQSNDASLTCNKLASSMFQTASSKKVHVSEDALQQAKIWDDDDMINENEGTKFQTASGKNVHVSDSAMKHAKQTIDAESGGKQTEKSSIGIGNDEKFTSSLFQTARGGKVTVSRASLEAAKEEAMYEELFSQPKEYKASLFKTASGKHVEVSQESLKAAKEAMHEELSSEPKECKASLFQTASGKHVEVSENALKQSGKIFDDSFKETTKSNSCLTDRRITPSEEKRQFPKPQSIFQTASGRSVAVSEKALEQTKELFDDTPKQATCSPFSTPVPSLKGTRKVVEHTKPSIVEAQSLFQTASGQNVSVSKKALERTKERFDDTPKQATSSPFMMKGTPKVVEHDQQAIVDADNGNNSLRKIIRNSVKSNGIVQKNAIKPSDDAVMTTASEILECPTDSPPMDLDDSEFGKGCRMPNRVPRTADAQDVTDKTDMFQRKRKPMYTQPEVYFKDRISKSEKRMKPFQCQDLFQNKCSNPKSLLAALLPSDASNLPQPSNFRTPYKPTSTTISTVTPEATKSTTRTPHRPVWPTSEPIRISSEAEVENKMDTSKTSSPEHILMQESSVLSTVQNNACIFEANQLQKLRAAQDDIINKKKKVKIRPALGQLLSKKLSCSKFKLSELFRPRWPTKRSIEQIQASDTSWGPASVTSLNAAGFRFHLSEYYCNSLQQVIVGDGALLVPDDAGFVGKEEFYRSFVTIDSVDPSLVSEAWMDNHYRWIVWKLAGYEMSCPQLWAGRCLTPEMLMLQMKYRYDREIDRCERPSLRKIIEKDDTPSKRLVLCVSNVVKSISKPSKDTEQQALQDPQVMLELTDGWYSIKASLDPMLTRLVHNRRIRTGQKLCITGSELLGSEEACSPLEAPASLMLKLTGNSTRPARWDAKLGFQLNPQPFVVPLSSLQGDGGSVSCINAIIARIYPQMYMEKCAQGPCVFRCARAEEKVANMCKQNQEHRMEKLYAKVEADFEKEESKDIRRPSGRRRKWTSQAIEKLQVGQEIYDALQSSLEPDVIQNQLSSFQLQLLYDYRQQLNEDRCQAIHTRFQSQWKEAEESNPPRTVIPLIKMHLAGCCRADVDNKKGAMLTMWRPSGDLLSVLKEGRRYKVTGLSASMTRKRFASKDIQLSASRNSRFVETPVDENFLDLIYEPREVLMVRDLRNNSEGNTEVDFVGTVVKILSKEVGDSGKLLEIAYMVDSCGDIVLVKFWGGLKTFNLEDVVSAGCAVACRNLILKPARRSSVPSLDANTEMSVFTQNPQDPMLNAALSKHRSTTKSISNFLDNAREKVQQLIQGGWKSKAQFAQETPEKPLGAASHNHDAKYSTTVSFQEENSVLCPNNAPLSEERIARKMINKSKTAKLLSYGQAPQLTNLESPIPNTVRCDFRPPRQDKAL